MLDLCLALAACGVAFLILKRVFQPKQPWPPGPPARPLLGHLHLLGDLPHQSLCNLSKIYGPLMGLRFGSHPAIIVSSPAMAKEILQTHDLAFANRPWLVTAVHMYSNGTNMGFAPYGPYWKFLRQLFATEVFSSKRLEASRHVREEEIHALTLSVLQTAREKPEALVEPRATLLATSNDINCRLMMGKRISEFSNAMTGKGDLLSLVEEVMYLLCVFNVGDFIPWIAWLDLQGYEKRMKAAGRRCKAVMQAVIDERKESYKRKEANAVRHNDLLDVLLHAAAHDDGIPITDDNIVAIILDVFVGGSDTSSVTVEWALANLINHPEVMQRVQEELDEVVGKARWVKEVDIPALPYLGTVIKESMRMHPVVPLLIPHVSAQECQIGGYRLPAKTRAYVNTWAIGRDPTIWERPLDFWPERFRENNLDVHGQNFELLPFGSGRRKCPGYALGLLNVHLMLASLVQGFTWSLVPPNAIEAHGHKQLDMSERFGLTVAMAKPLRAFAIPRLPSHLY